MRRDAIELSKYLHMLVFEQIIFQSLIQILSNDFGHIQ